MLLALVLVACSSASPSTEMPAPTSTPIPQAVNEPSVTVADQAIMDGKVVIAKVVSDGSGWLVIHAQRDGGVGPVLGYSPVADGANAQVAVEINLTDATETLYAMLHTDAGTVGTYEFPGDDVPVKISEKVVAPPFSITGGLAVEEITPSVAVVNQEIVDGTVTVAEVVSDGPGWLVIHVQQDGKPGSILGYSPVADGVNADVAVEIDLSGATETLYAMLHTDAGMVGTYEFPGDDAPTKVDDAVVMAPFVLLVVEGEAEVRMAGFAFDQTNLIVRAGTTITWINNDPARHTATSDTGIWDSGMLGQDESFSLTFDEPGIYPYHCKPHGGPGGQGMAGTIVVILA